LEMATLFTGFTQYWNNPNLRRYRCQLVSSLNETNYPSG
jgi:hypothetical protein